MIISGSNLAVTSYGKKLPDGSLAILRDEHVDFCIAEERLSRIKSDGGFSDGMAYYLRRYKRSLVEIDLYVFSSCCDLVGRAPIPLRISPSRSMFCPHHLSHALGSFAWSPFDRATCLVVDSGGDNLEEFANGAWWEARREQHSAFFISTTQYDLLERHASEARVAGFGELFRAFTFYLGWPGARYAGNTMALSTLGDLGPLRSLRLFDYDGTTFFFHVANDPNSPVEMIHSFLAANGFGFIAPRTDKDPFTSWHFALAAFLQQELERYLEIAIRRAVKQTQCANVILSGGVGYNCLSIGHLRERITDINLFVQPASGDVGQGFGNCCYGFFQSEGRMPVIVNKRPDLGGRYRPRQLGAEQIAAGALIALLDPDVVRFAAEISAGKIGVWFEGRSEYGPRALGHRSIVGAAAVKANKRRLNRLKRRGYFMPIAPATLQETADRYFYCPNPKPYMTEVVKLREPYHNDLGAAAHSNGWCRIQTVSSESQPRFHQLIRLVGERTGAPIILNTSLNGPRQPIIEEPHDALTFLLDNDVDCCWIEGVLFLKTTSGGMSERLPIDASSFSIALSEAPEQELGTLREVLQLMFPDLLIRRRQSLSLRATFLQWVEDMTKETTIRYKKGAVEYPSARILPMYRTERYEPVQVGKTPFVGEATITKISYKAFGDLDVKDALNDGFRSLAELRSALAEIYGPIAENEIVTIYTISFAKKVL
jgi:carbamoyltransferase